MSLSNKLASMLEGLFAVSIGTELLKLTKRCHESDEFDHPGKKIL
jgi:hypothetical protein